MNSDAKAHLHEQSAAHPPSCGKSDVGGPMPFSDAPDTCIEACNTRNFEFEKEFGVVRDHFRRDRSKARTFLFRFFALLAAAGILLWQFVPKHFVPNAPHVQSTFDVHQGEFGNSNCNDPVAFAETYEFGDVKTFTLRNLMETSRRYDRFRNSFVQILPSEDQKEDILVDFSFKTSDPELQNLLDIKRTDESLVISFPTMQSTQQTGFREYIETQTKIYVRSGLKLQKFEIESRILGISIPSSIDLWVDDAKLVCTTGRLEANPLFNARRTIIRENTGVVTGTFPLYDVLDIETNTGAVNVDIVPRPADKADVQPAKLFASTHTGAIHIGYKVQEKLPERDYRVNVKSHTGMITGWFVHGTFTQLESPMGAITATILPYAADRYTSTLTTTTRTGRQSITVLPPYVDTKKPLARLEGTHRSGTGAVNVQYPNAWEGTVEAVTKTGSVSVSGPGLHKIKEDKGVVGKIVEAEKGHGDGRSLCRTETGSVKFSVDYV